MVTLSSSLLPPTWSRVGAPSMSCQVVTSTRRSRAPSCLMVSRKWVVLFDTGCCFLGGDAGAGTPNGWGQLGRQAMQYTRTGGAGGVTATRKAQQSTQKRSMRSVLFTRTNPCEGRRGRRHRRCRMRRGRRGVRARRRGFSHSCRRVQICFYEGSRRVQSVGGLRL